MKQDLYDKVTAKIIEALEQGCKPWLQPWNAQHAAGRISRPLRANGENYNGINVLLLWSESMSKGYANPIWCTFKQADDLGGHVRKGEHGTKIVYADRFRKTETDGNGNEVEKDIPFLKEYTVFNVEQVDGLPEKFYALAAPVIDPVERNAAAEAFFAATKANIGYGGNRAYYRISEDVIQMPPFETFKDAPSFYATLSHESIHFTRHPSRLDRDLGRKRFGDEGYAMEELVAEIGSAFLCCELGLTSEIRDNHASYIENWLRVLKNDNRAIFTAASFAQKAVDYLQSLQPA